MRLLVFSASRGVAGGGGGTGSLTAAAGPGGGASGGGVPAGRQEPRRRFPTVRAGEQPGDGRAGSQQGRGTKADDSLTPTDCFKPSSQNKGKI